jgi:hypothetical protein
MRKVERGEIVDYETYRETRELTRKVIIGEIKPPRRVDVGDYLTFVFENADTVRYQIQEMMLAEKIVKEADILHEIETYKALLADDGELGCTLLVGVQDAAERARRLREWRDLPAHVYVRCADGTRVRARYDRAQIDGEKISAVQYLQFPLGGRRPVAVGCDLPALTTEATLSAEQQAALTADLAG